MKKRALCWLLALVMVFSLIPAFGVSAQAADGDEEGESISGLHVDKSISMNESDGTYTIRMDAYATGEAMIQKLDKNIPLDVVLVMDQSSSIEANDMPTGYEVVGRKQWTFNQATNTRDSNNQPIAYYYHYGSGDADYARVEFEGKGYLYKQTYENPKVTKDFIEWSTYPWQSSDWAYSRLKYYVYDESDHTMHRLYLRTKGYTVRDVVRGNGGDYAEGGWFAEFFYLKNEKDYSGKMLGTVDSKLDQWFKENGSSIVYLKSTSGRTRNSFSTGVLGLGVTPIDSSLTFTLQGKIYESTGVSDGYRLYYLQNDTKHYLTDPAQTANGGETDASNMVLFAAQPIYFGDLYYMATGSTRKAAMVSAAKALVRDLAEDSGDHRVAVVGFAGNEADYTDPVRSNAALSSRLYTGNDGNCFANTGFYKPNGSEAQFQPYAKKGYVAETNYSKLKLADVTNGEYYLFLNGATVVDPNNPNGSYKPIATAASVAEQIKYTFNDGKNISTAKIDKNTSVSLDSINKGKVKIYKLTPQETAKEEYTGAFFDVKTEQGLQGAYSALNQVKGFGNTFPSYGMKMAEKIFDQNPPAQGETRKRIVIVISDGVPGTDAQLIKRSETNDYEVNSNKVGVVDVKEYYKALDEAQRVKDQYSASVYSIWVAPKNTTESASATKFLQELSSHYYALMEKVYEDNDGNAPWTYSTTYDRTTHDEGPQITHDGSIFNETSTKLNPYRIYYTADGKQVTLDTTPRWWYRTTPTGALTYAETGASTHLAYREYGSGTYNYHPLTDDTQEDRARKASSLKSGYGEIYMTAFDNKYTKYDAIVYNSASLGRNGFSSKNAIRNSSSSPYGLESGQAADYFVYYRTKWLVNGLTSSAIDPKMSATDTSNWRTQLYGLKAHRFDTNGAVYYYETGAESQIRFALDTISEEVKESTTTFTLDENSVLSCAFPENGQFDLANALEQSVAVKTVGITMNADGTVSESDTPTVLSNAKINTSDNTVTVSGFAYSDYYVTADHAGQKLIVEISGLKPHKAGRLSADGDSAVYKVTPETGETLQVASFPGVSDCYVPLEPKVQDFSTSFTVTDNMLNYNDATGAMTRSNGAFQFAKPNLTFQLNKLNLSNEGGTFRLDTGVNSIPYVDNTPQAENWHWSMAYLIPANNIYYDEDLTGKTGNSTSDGYGYNSAAEDAPYHAANVSRADKMVTLEFTFTGTGIDVYCTTGSDTGDVIYMLDGKGAKVMKNKNANDTIYNVPTVSLRDLDPVSENDYTHTLKIIVAKNANYAIDGIRVYRPMAGNATAEAIYAETKEANATFELVRERLLNGSASFDENTAFSADDAQLYGTLYLSGDHTTEITQEYRNNSPKSEVYLDKGEGVAFQIDGYDKDHQKVMIGLSAPREGDNSGEVMVSNGSDSVKKIAVNSAVDMYYLVQPDDNGNVFVKNNGSALISVTRVKLTDDGMQAVAAETEPAQESPSRLIVSKSLLRYVESFDTLPVSEDAPETTPIPAEPEPSATPTPQPGGIGQIVQNLVSSLFQTIFQNISSLFRGLSKW